MVATWLNLPDPELYTGHSLRRTSATLLADGGGNENDLMRHGGWKSATVARSYVEKSLYNQKEINKKITNVINLKTHIVDEQIPSTSKENEDVIININNFENESENELQERVDYIPTETQNATFGSPSKNRKRKDENEDRERIEITSKNRKIEFNFTNCNVTINIYNDNKK